MQHFAHKDWRRGINRSGLLLVFGIVFLAKVACQDNVSLYDDIDTVITGAETHSHYDSTYTPVPDSLRLRFQRQLRMLRCTVASTGCDPHLETKLEESASGLTIRFDMNNGCVHPVAEGFDVDIYVSPVHADTFALVIEEVDFESTDSAARRVVLSRRVDVRMLPGF